MVKSENSYIRYFGNPVQYAGLYYPNSIAVISNADLLKIKRSGDKVADFYARHHTIEVPEEILKYNRTINQFFLDRGIIIGPEIGQSGYLNYEGGEERRLDIFGKPVKECGWRFFADERIIDGAEFRYRAFSITDKSKINDIHEHCLVFQKSARGAMLSLEEDDDDYNRYFEDGEIKSEIIFVRDLDDAEEIKDEITDMVFEDFGCEYFPLEISETIDQHNQIKCSDAISFEIEYD